MNDPVIDEIRRVRKLISAEMGHDPSRMVEYYQAVEASFTRPAIAPKKPRNPVASGVDIPLASEEATGASAR